jgi:uncharacterized protein YndB with AHSA1/START domain
MSTNKTVDVTMPSDTEVRVTRYVDAPADLAWEAWTNPKYLPRWMLGPPGWTMPVCEIDLRVGGTWRFVWRHGDGQEMAMTGVYKEIVRPERLVCTESWGPQWPETLTTLTLTEKDGRTLVSQTILYPSKEAREAALKTGMVDGMSMSFDRIDELLRSLQ